MTEPHETGTAGRADEPAALGRLRDLLGAVDDLQRAAELLSWDRQTYMPPAGGAARAEQEATLQRLAHQRLTADEVGEALAELGPWAAGQPHDSFGASLVRVATRRYERERRLPAELVAETARAEAQAYDAWLAARAARDFRSFAEPFARLVTLARRAADCYGWQVHPFEAFLAEGEPGMSGAELDALLERLRDGLIPLVRAIAERQDLVSDAPLRQDFDAERQWQLTIEAVTTIGFDVRERGRQDRSVHPFTTSFGWGDVRVTTRIDPHHLARGLLASIHEAGHGLYEQGLPAELWRTPLAQGASTGVHESQSRLWENVVGRSRAFWRFLLPEARRLFPAQLDGVDVEAIYRAVNRSRPSLVRVDADEATYNLHVIVRYEIERGLLSGDLAAADVPAAWSERMQAYLGVRPADDLEGALQDIHWAAGLFGYFPSYTLGNVMALQLYDRALAERPEIPDAIARGDCMPLLDWLRAHVHVHGAKLTPAELMVRETGRGLDAGPYLAYLRQKYGELYDL